MNNFNLNSGWKIRSDTYNWILIKERAGKHRENVMGYYGNLESCLNAYIQFRIKDFNSTNLQGLQNSINSLQTHLNTLITSLNLEVVKKAPTKEFVDSIKGLENG